MANSAELQDLYKVTRAQTEHIDNTISQRIVWLVITQSFFFSAYAIVITSDPAKAFLPQKQGLLSLLLPIVALIMIALSYLDIIAGIIYISKLCGSFCKRLEEGNGSKSDYPPIGG